MTKELIIRKESKRYPGLFTVKYHNRVFYDNLWNDELIESRGRVELADGTVVVNPFTKVFNRNENGTDIDPMEPCIASYKINGFMIAATYVPQVDQVVLSTTGSLDFDFVDMAEEFFTDRMKVIIKTIGKGQTLLFEVCHKNDPHIIPEDEGLYLIGCRKVSDKTPYFSTIFNEYYLDNLASILGCKRSSYIVGNFINIAKMVQSPDFKLEGFVVYGQVSKTVLKLKSPYYLAMKAIARVKDIEKLNKKYIDEEFYSLIDYLLLNKEEFQQLDEQSKLQFLRDYYNE